MKPAAINRLFQNAKTAIAEKVQRTDPQQLWHRFNQKLRQKDLNRLLFRLNNWEKQPARLRFTDRKDLLLLLLYVRGRTGKTAEPLLGMTRIMKLVFIAVQELFLAPLVRNPYRFVPYKLGPWAPELYLDLETLIDAGLVRAMKLDPEGVPVIALDSVTAGDISRLNSGISAAERLDSLTLVFKLTPRGRRFARALMQAATKRQKNILPGLEIVKTQFGALPLTQLLRYVYTRYPEYTSQSEIVEKVFGKPAQT